MPRRCFSPESKKRRVIKDRTLKGPCGDVEQTETASFPLRVSPGNGQLIDAGQHAYVPVDNRHTKTAGIRVVRTPRLAPLSTKSIMFVGTSL